MVYINVNEQGTRYHPIQLFRLFMNPSFTRIESQTGCCKIPTWELTGTTIAWIHAHSEWVVAVIFGFHFFFLPGNFWLFRSGSCWGWFYYGMHEALNLDLAVDMVYSSRGLSLSIYLPIYLSNSSRSLRLLMKRISFIARGPMRLRSIVAIGIDIIHHAWRHFSSLWKLAVHRGAT